LEYFKSSLLCPKNGFQAKDDCGSEPADESAHRGTLIGNLPPHPSSDNYSDTGGSSNVAVSLLSGQTTISGFTLNEFQDLESSLKPFAEAEQEILSCALLVANTIKEADAKALLLGIIAGGYAKAGQKEKAGQILTQALETANTIKNRFPKDRALAGIADAYAEGGQFTQALETANTIKYFKETKARVLAGIASGYAKAGQKEKADQILTQALKTANTCVFEGPKARALAEIASAYAEAGQQPSEKDMVKLRDTVHTIKPMRFLGDLSRIE
jgi:tetratricopeptide (TPR) repeat protein